MMRLAILTLALILTGCADDDWPRLADPLPTAEGPALLSDTLAMPSQPTQPSSALPSQAALEAAINTDKADYEQLDQRDFLSAQLQLTRLSQHAKQLSRIAETQNDAQAQQTATMLADFVREERARLTGPELR